MTIRPVIDIKESWYGLGPPESWSDWPEIKKMLEEGRMPLTKKGAKIKKAMEKEYGEEKGERVFYASINKGTVSGAEGRSTVKGAESAKHERKEKKGR